jgi:PAS domain-containing protein
VVHLTLGWKRIYANQAYLDFIGQGILQWLEGDSEDHVSPDDLHRSRLARQLTLRIKQPSVTNIRMIAAAGRIRRVRWIHEPILDDFCDVAEIRCVGMLLSAKNHKKPKTDGA